MFSSDNQQKMPLFISNYYTYLFSKLTFLLLRATLTAKRDGDDAVCKHSYRWLNKKVRFYLSFNSYDRMGY